MFNKWLVIFAFTTSVFVAAWFYGIVPWLLALDTTYMSHTVVGLYFITSIYLGYLIKTTDGWPGINDEFFEWMRENFNWVGLFGTLWFITIYFQGAHLGSIDLSNITEFKKAILHIADGMSVALIPTLMGMVAERALSVQLRVIK